MLNINKYYERLFKWYFQAVTTETLYNNRPLTKIAQKLHQLLNYRNLLRYKNILKYGNIVIEVGSYLGDDALIELCRSLNCQLYMFEPDSELYGLIAEKVRPYDNLHVLNKAVSVCNGKTKFYISNHKSRSSVHKFIPSVNKLWGDTFGNFHMLSEVEVNVTRLDTFMEENNISHVDLIIIDAQGEDLNVIKSLGDKITQCKRIQAEACVYKYPLYENVFTKKELTDYMKKYGFVVEKTWKDAMGRLENILFKQNDDY